MRRAGVKAKKSSKTNNERGKTAALRGLLPRSTVPTTGGNGMNGSGAVAAGTRPPNDMNTPYQNVDGPLAGLFGAVSNPVLPEQDLLQDPALNAVGGYDSNPGTTSWVGNQRSNLPRELERLNAQRKEKQAVGNTARKNIALPPYGHQDATQWQATLQSMSGMAGSTSLVQAEDFRFHEMLRHALSTHLYGPERDSLSLFECGSVHTGPCTETTSCSGESAVFSHNGSIGFGQGTSVTSVTGISSSAGSVACSHAGCGKRFTLRSEMKKHARIHIDKQSRPFACICGCKKTFVDRRELQRHLVQQSGAKPFGCDQCGRRFARRDNLQRHNGTVHNV